MTLTETIESAKAAIIRHGYNHAATVTETRSSKTARKSSFGFRFFTPGEIGTEIKNDDGSISVIRAIVAA